MGEELITDFFGVPIGKITTDADGESTVTDYYGRPLGHAGKNGTNDFFGRPVSKQNCPGLLFSKDHNPQLKDEEEARARDEKSKREHQKEIEAARVRQEENDARERAAQERERYAEEAKRREEEEAAQRTKDELQRRGERVDIAHAFQERVARKTGCWHTNSEVDTFIKEHGRLPMSEDEIGSYAWKWLVEGGFV